MAKHIQPTKEDLAEKNKEIIGDLDKLAQEYEKGGINDDADQPDDLNPDNQDPSKKTDDESGKGDDDTKDEGKSSDDDANGDSGIKHTDGESDEDKGDDDQDSKEPSIEERYKSSTQESQVLHAQNKKMLEAFKQVKNVPEPTDEEMTKEYPEWEDMSDSEKRFAKNDWKNNKRFEAINRIAEDTENAEAWSGKVNEFIDDPETLQKNPKLEGKVEEFKAFSNKPTRRGADFEDLVKAFLFEVSESKPPKKKGKMFEQGSGGDNKKAEVDDGKMSIEQGMMLKKTNYKAYVQAVKEKKIRNEFE